MNLLATFKYFKEFEIMVKTLLKLTPKRIDSDSPNRDNSRCPNTNRAKQIKISRVEEDIKDNDSPNKIDKDSRNEEGVEDSDSPKYGIVARQEPDKMNNKSWGQGSELRTCPTLNKS